MTEESAYRSKPELTPAIEIGMSDSKVHSVASALSAEVSTTQLPAGYLAEAVRAVSLKTEVESLIQAFGR